MGRPLSTNPFFAGSGNGPIGAIVRTGARSTLEEALRTYMAARGLELVSLRSRSRTRISILFRFRDNSYCALPVEIGAHSGDIDDALYDAAVIELDAFVKAQGNR